MTRDELANAASRYIMSAVGSRPTEAFGLASIIELARGRFLGVGAEQYQISENEQSFERSTVGTMLVGAIEENVDQLNYATMIDILAERRLAALAAGEADDIDDGDGTISEALDELRADLREMARLAAASAVFMTRHIDRLVALGEYERRGESDYVAQLSAECDEAGAPMQSQVAEAFQAARVAAEREYLGCETPAGLDAIVAAYDEAANEVLATYGVCEFVGLPAPEYEAGKTYIAELERALSEAHAADAFIAESLDSVRDTVAERGNVDERALREWFSE